MTKLLHFVWPRFCKLTCLWNIPESRTSIISTSMARRGNGVVAMETAGHSG